MTTYTIAQDWYDARETWREELDALRALVLNMGLTETVKWKHPCYMHDDKNILIISVRKDYAIASLLRGALFDDPRGRLVQPGQDRSVRYMPFTSVAQIQADRAYLEGLISDGIEAARAGLKVAPLSGEVEYVEELQQRLSADEDFRIAFEGLTPGRQRGYNLHFEKAKKSSTREARITRCTERILMGKGLMDCICGRSKRPPGCDGSHKFI